MLTVPCTGKGGLTALQTLAALLQKHNAACSVFAGRGRTLAGVGPPGEPGAGTFCETLPAQAVLAARHTSHTPCPKLFLLHALRLCLAL